jgi:hypothetical protein
VAVELLRLRADLDSRALAQRHIEHAIGSEHQTRTVVHRPVVCRHRAEDHSDLLQTSPVGREYPARHAGRVPSLAGLGIAPVDRAIGVEFRTQQHVEKTTLASGVHARHPADGLTQASRRTHDPHAARLFGDEHVSAGKRLDCPRMLESLCEHDHVERHVGLHGACPGLSLESGPLVRRVPVSGFQWRTRAVGSGVSRAARCSGSRVVLRALTAGSPGGSKKDDRQQGEAGGAHGSSPDRRTFRRDCKKV